MPAAIHTNDCCQCGCEFDPAPRRAAGEHDDFCSAACFDLCAEVCARDMAAEARTLGPIEDGTALERFRDWECHAIHGDS